MGLREGGPVGGTFQAEPTELGGFTVRASFPLAAGQ